MPTRRMTLLAQCSAAVMAATKGLPVPSLLPIVGCGTSDHRDQREGLDGRKPAR